MKTDARIQMEHKCLRCGRPIVEGPACGWCAAAVQEAAAMGHGPPPPPRPGRPVKAPPEDAAAPRKDDTGKHLWTLFPWRGAILALGVIEYGARKYSPSNWVRVLQAEDGENRYVNAAQRHLVAHMTGERLDPETGLPHLAHAVCSLLFILSNPDGFA